MKAHIYKRTMASLRNGQYTTSGTLVYNFYDEIAGTNYSYASVIVTPKSGTSGDDLNFGVDWTHTYTEQDIQTTVSTQLGFGGDGLINGSIGCSVTVSSNQMSWGLSDTNAITIS